MNRARGTCRPLLLGLESFSERPSGLNRYFRDLYAALQTEDGCEPSGVVLGIDGDRLHGLEAVSSPHAPLPARLWAYARAATELGASADLVDAHFALYARLPLAGRRLRRLPLVVHFQGPWADESRSAGETSRLRGYVKHRIERSVYRRADRVVVLSQAFRRLLIERYRVSPWIVDVVPPGVDLERFSPAARQGARSRLELPAEAWIVGSVRRLVPRTGLGVVLDAWAQIAPTHDRALLAVAGEGPQRGELEARANELGIGDRVRFLGRLDDGKLVDLYRAADVCVVPSVELEGFGLVVLEALACGTPVVASAVGGLRDALHGLDPSLLVPARDEDALARRLAGAVAGTKPLPSRSSCRTFAERYEWRRVSAAHDTLYRAVADHDRRRDRMRVVYLDHCAELSGAELALARLLPAFRDVEPHVLLAVDGPLVSRLQEDGISVEVLPMPTTARTVRRGVLSWNRLPLTALLLSAVYTLRVARRLRQLDPDLVHTNSLKAGFYGSLAARLARVPVVWHLRDRISPDYLPPAAVRVARWAIRRLPDALVANSNATLATVGELPGEVPRVIHSPIVIEARRREGGDPLRIGVVGRLAPWKGQDVFLEAFARAFPDGRQTAVVIGSALFGEDDYERRLRTRAQELGLDGRVTFTGFVDDVESELLRLDVLVHSSVIPEPFGQVVVEGMAAGVPVVASDGGGPKEIVEHGVNGFLYPPGDVEALAATLRFLAERPDRCRAVVERALAKADEFRPEAIAEQWTSVYRSLMAARRRRSAS